MSLIELPSLDSLDVLEVQEAADTIATRFQEKFPAVNLPAGVVRELLIDPHGQLATLLQELIDEYESNMTPADVLANPDTSPEWALNALLANWRLTRNPATAARGEIAVLRNVGTTLTLPTGFSFSGDGQDFVTETVYSIKSDEALVTSSTDILATQVGADRWLAYVPVVASVPGAAGMLQRGVPVLPGEIIEGLITAYAASDFAGGADADSGEVLTSKLELAASAPSLSGPVNMQAWLLKNFPSVVRSSVIGFGYAEMLRDRHWIWPSSGGGKVDWYIRTENEYQDLQVQLTASLAEKLPDNTGIWQVNLPRTIGSGFYDIISVLPAGSSDAGSLQITTDQRSYATTGDEQTPEIADVLEAVYSTYQTGAVRFHDPAVNVAALSLGATGTYDLIVRCVPSLKAIQDMVQTDTTRPAAADVLVKAPVPCFVTVRLKATVPVGSVVTAGQLQQALADAVNAEPFTGKLHVARLYKAAQDLLGVNGTIEFLEARGRLRLPDGSFVPLIGRDTLNVPENAELMTTANTVQFFAKAADCSVQLTTIS